MQVTPENYPGESGREELLTGPAWLHFNKWLRSQIRVNINPGKPPKGYHLRPGEWIYLCIGGSWTNWPGMELFIRIALIRQWAAGLPNELINEKGVLSGIVFLPNGDQEFIEYINKRYNQNYEKQQQQKGD